ncbi:MAG: ABC transporter permease [Actinobacteria bacterium]|nr:ABC transporter permease [Actinomycetota bacterium]
MTNGTSTETIPVGPTPAADERRLDAVRVAQNYGIYAVLVVIVIVATIVYSGFLSPDNIKLVLSQNAPLGIVAVGMTLVIIGGGFDLSVGAIFAVSGTAAAMIATHHGAAEGFVVGVALGLVCGLINAIVITRFRVNPFVATLGSSSLFSGVIMLISNSNPFFVEKTSFTWLGQTKLLGVQLPTILLGIVFLLGWLVLNRSVYGRRVLAVGGNPEASRLAGVRTDLVQGGTYVISGLLAAFAGAISASQLSVGQGTAGGTMALQSIAVVVIGGTSLLGGEGSMTRTAVGLLILATLDNIFFSLAVDTNWQLISQGIIVIGAVALDQLFRRMRTK